MYDEKEEKGSKRRIRRCRMRRKIIRRGVG